MFLGPAVWRGGQAIRSASADGNKCSGFSLLALRKQIDKITLTAPGWQFSSYPCRRFPHARAFSLACARIVAKRCGYGRARSNIIGISRAMHGRFPPRSLHFEGRKMERRAIDVQGVVQGVGFRPFVYALAARLKLAGFVKNCVGDLLIEVEGEAATLDDFLSELTAHPPPLARIEHLAWQSLPQEGDQQFLIHDS